MELELDFTAFKKNLRDLIESRGPLFKGHRRGDQRLDAHPVEIPSGRP